MNINHEKRLKGWLESGELPGDMYELLGLPRFCEQRERLQEAADAAYRFVHAYEQHGDAEIRSQSFQLEKLLGQARHVITHSDNWRTYDRNLVRKLFEQYRSGVGDDAVGWRPDRVRHWLETAQNVRPARLDELVAAFIALAKGGGNDGIDSVALAEPTKRRRRTRQPQPDTEPEPVSAEHPPAAAPRVPGLKRRYQTVGIDLGTTYSAVAYVDKDGEPQVVHNPDDHRPILPSAVFFDGDDIIVGEDALVNANVYPGDVAQFVKREMGEPASFLMGDGQKEYNPETISAIILKKLVSYAEPAIGPITKAVITVPAYFNEKRRAATEHAGTIAGLEVADLLNEPSAALIAYGLHKEKQQKVYVVYDLGGGTFDVAIMRVGDGKLQELASGGNRKLGGCDWDEALLNDIADAFVEQYGADPREDAVSYQTLLTDCRKAKVQLSSRQRTSVRCTHAGQTLPAEITRDQFQKRTARLLGKTRLTIEACLSDAGCQWQQVAGVVLVGGSTAMPMVREMIRGVSGKEPLTSVDPELAVAKGAAIYAGVLETSGPIPTLRAATYRRREGATNDQSPKGGTVSLVPRTDQPDTHRISDDLGVPLDLTLVNAHGIGVYAVQKDEPVNVVMIPRNSELPKTETRLFRLRRDNVRQLTVTITEGDSEQRPACEVLGTCFLGPLPSLPQGTVIELRLGYGKNGRVQVSARCPETKTSVGAELQTEAILTPREVDQERRCLAIRHVC